MNNSKKGSVGLVLLVIAVVIVLVIIGNSYFKQGKEQQANSVPVATENGSTVNAVAQVKPVNEIPASTNASTDKNYELLTYSGKTDNGKNFTIKYPSSWTYYKFSCNVGGVAFWPKNIAPDFSKNTGGSCNKNFIDGAPIILYTTGSQPSIELNNNFLTFKDIFSQMKGSLTY